MQEHLAGDTYDGQHIVADVKIRSCPVLPECGRVIVGPDGFVLISPLPDDRFLIFVNRDEADTRTERPTEDELRALLNARAGVDVGMHDLQWVSYFKMHKRATERLSDGRRFLLGDAASSVEPARRGRHQRSIYGRGRYRLETCARRARGGETVAARQLRGRAGDSRSPCAGSVGRNSRLCDAADRDVQKAGPCRPCRHQIRRRPWR